MTGPRVVCFGCGKETTPMKPVCDACMVAVGEKPIAYCPLCEALLVAGADVLPAERGIHRTKSGGYAGKCAAVFTTPENV